MAATISEYLVKAANLKDGSAKFKEKLRVLGDQYDSLAGFKNATVNFLEGLKNAEQHPLIKRFTDKEKTLLAEIQNEILETETVETNFVQILTRNFIRKQLSMLDDMNLDDLNSNPLLCAALKLNNVHDLVQYNVYALATRSIVTSMGYLVQDLLLYSSADVYQGKEYPEGKDVKWDLVVERLDAVRSYIEVKSGPNDLDKGQVKHYLKEIKAVERLGHKGYIGITYGKRESDTVSINLFKEYIPRWNERTLIGTELWDFITGNDEYHSVLTEQISQIAESLLDQQSIVSKIEDTIQSLETQFTDKYRNIQEYINQLW